MGQDRIDAQASSSRSSQEAPDMASLEPGRPRAPSVLAAPWLRTANSTMGLNGKAKATTSDAQNSSPQKRREVRRMQSMYSSASIATTQEQTAGASTYDYDVNTHIRRQQQRRRRNENDSQASISTQASKVSYAPSFTSVLAQGEFIRAPPSIRAPRRMRNDEDQQDENGGVDAPQEDAIDVLQRVRRDSVASRYSTVSVPRRRGGGGSGGGRNGKATAAAPAGGTLSDTLEHIIANSASYRAAGPSRSRYGTFARAPETDVGDFPNGQSMLWPSPSQQRMPTSTSSKSLAAFAAHPTQRRTDKGKGHATAAHDRIPASTSSRSGWGSTFSGAQRAMSLWAFGGPQAAPTMSSAPLRTAQATIAMPSENAIAHGLPAYRTRLDTSDTLRDLRSLLATGRAPAQGGGGRSSAVRTDANKNATLRPPSPQKQRHSPKTSGRATLQALYTPPGASNGDHVSEDLPAAHAGSAANGNHASTSRRAFAALDPTSHDPAPASNGHDHGPRPRLSRHTTRSSGHLSHRSAEGVQPATPASPSLASSANAETSSGGMPALDPTLARAEAQSGLAKKSRCSLCDKCVVNAPMTRSGEVFCGRECRVAMKQKRKTAAGASSLHSSSPASTASLKKAQAVVQMNAGGSDSLTTRSPVPPPAQSVAAATST